MTKKGQVLFTASAFLIISGFATLGFTSYKANQANIKITNQHNLQEQQIKLNSDLIGETQDKQAKSYDALQKQVTEQSDEIASLKEQLK